MTKHDLLRERDRKPSMKFVADVDEVIEAARHANKVRRRYERALDAACEYIWEATKEAPEGATWKEYFLQGVEE